MKDRKPVMEKPDASREVSDSGEENLTGHSYDGIQEYDNPLPGWWKLLFWATILFSPVYYVYFHSGVEGRTIEEQYTSEMAGIFQRRFKKIGDLNPDRETLLRFIQEDKEWLSVGKATYITNCASCHAPDGSGLVGGGPNLTDDHWLNVKTIEDIADVIENGANNGAMPAWKKRLSHPNLVVLTAAYVASLREETLEGPRGTEGNKIPDWDEIKGDPVQ